MDATAGLHPTDQTLHDYGLGKLDVRSSDSVEQHLDDCDDCRRRVGELSGDSFLGRLQHAQHPNSTPPPPPPPPAGSLPPELASHPDYEVLRELGRGGMGVVYLANNRLMGRPEVLKVVGKHLIQKPNVLDRFLREIRSAARLQHPNIVAAYSAMRLGDGVVLAMEYVDGLDLAQMVKAKGALPVTHAAYFVHQAALGLQHAHERGMVHRDIKPANLILARDGKKAVVKVLDFGLAKVTSEAPVDGGLTQEGQMLGTPDYIAPEQTINAQKADIRADIYSLGCTLYYLLTGGPPFRGTSLYDILQAHHSMDAKLLNLVRPEVPVELAALVAKMMAKDPERRFQTPGAVAQALAPFFKPGAARGPGPDAEVPRVQAPARAARPDAAPAAEAAKPAPAPEPVPPRPNPSRKVGAEGVAWESLIEFKETERSTPEVAAPQPPAAAGPGARRPWVGPAVAAGAILLALAVAWATVVLAVKVKTPDGTIVLEGLPEHAEVLVDGSKVQVVVPGRGGPAEVSVPPGKHGVQVKKDGVKVFGDEVTVELGNRAEIHVRLDRPTGPDAGAAKAKAEVALPDLAAGATGGGAVEDGFESLFNGEDLSRWFVDRGDPSIWRVEDGQIVADAPNEYWKHSFLLSERSFSDFLLRFECHLPRDSDSGVALRADPGEVPSPVEISLRNFSNEPTGHARTAALRWSTEGDSRGYWPPAGPDLLRPSSTWNEMEIELRGDSLKVSLNGRQVQDLDLRGFAARPNALAGLTRRSGRIGFQSHTGMVRFRNIRVKELPPSSPAPAGLEPSPGWVALFNGKDLTGWRTHPDTPSNLQWRVVDGVLVGSGPQASHLFSERGDFRDFHLRAEARINGGGNSGIFFRAPFGPGLPDGYEAQINSTAGDPRKTGSLYITGRGPVVDVRSFEHFPDTWFTLEVLAEGAHITIKVNSKVTADFTDARRQFAGGHIALQQYDARSVVGFRKVEIKEFEGAGGTAGDAIEKPSGATAGRPSGAPADARLFRGKAYKLFPQQLSWHEARVACREKGGHLAIVKGAEEDQFLVALMNNQGVAAVWLGATDERVEGRWVWVDGTAMLYRNWDPIGHQPNNKQGLEHYLVLWTPRGGKWADQPNRSIELQPGFVCQWD